MKTLYTLISILLFSIASTSLWAENIVYPPKERVYDVKAVYGGGIGVLATVKGVMPAITADVTLDRHDLRHSKNIPEARD
ncbi:MAG: hypothetical protein HC904_04140 [Blastochloris sp.]|nr:hypothetical protein [Blastochloris sp.]